MSARRTRASASASSTSRSPTAKLDKLVASGTDGNTQGATGLVFDTGVVSLPVASLERGHRSDGHHSRSAPVCSSTSPPMPSTTRSRASPAASSRSAGFRASRRARTTTASIRRRRSMCRPLPANAHRRDVRDPHPRCNPRSNCPTARSTSRASPRPTQAGADVLEPPVLARHAGHGAATLGGSSRSSTASTCAAAIAGMIGQQPPAAVVHQLPHDRLHAGHRARTDFFSERSSTSDRRRRQLHHRAGDGRRAAHLSHGAHDRHDLDRDAHGLDHEGRRLHGEIPASRASGTSSGASTSPRGFSTASATSSRALLGFLEESGVLIGSTLNNIIQDETAPDTVLVDITLDVPFPCNYIRLTLVI
jgi:hypothetical protein